MKGRALFLTLSVVFAGCGGGDSSVYAVGDSPAPAPPRIPSGIVSSQVHEPRMSTDDIYTLLVLQGRSQVERDLARREEELGKREANAQRLQAEADSKMTIANSVASIIGLVVAVGLADRLISWAITRRSRVASTLSPQSTTLTLPKRGQRRRKRRMKAM